ncbi:MAG: hypothetical protein DRO16_03875 [Thermoprotei archaeon]|nr:MAG: hypothetical protein DRO16_03875 [Thermoprotei archaeon]
MLISTRVRKNYTITLPKEICEKIWIREGTMLSVRVINNKIILEPLPDDPFRVLNELISEPYNERTDEKKAEEWLLRNTSH